MDQEKGAGIPANVDLTGLMPRDFLAGPPPARPGKDGSGVLGMTDGAYDPRRPHTDFGDYAFFLYSAPDGPLWIYGHVLPLAEIAAREKALGADDEEVAFVLANVRDAHSRGYRYGEWFSAVEPSGELGTNRDSLLSRMTVEQFEEARQHGWGPPATTWKPWWRSGSFPRQSTVRLRYGFTLEQN